jgi:dienelactone hydrolase
MTAPGDGGAGDGGATAAGPYPLSVPRPRTRSLPPAGRPRGRAKPSRRAGLPAPLVALVALLAVAMGSAVAGCADSGGSTDGDRSSGATSSTTTSVPLGTGDGTSTMRTVTYVDPSRPTGATPGRTLVTDIHVPGGEGPFPLIVHAHGLAGSSAKFSGLLSSWADAGYVVVAPNFPLTNDSVPAEQRDVNDVLQQPADVRFVLDRVLAANDGADDEGGELEGLIDPERIGVSGLSLGGATAWPLVFHSCCLDERFRSAVLMSALRIDLPGGSYDWSRRFPVLVFAGTADAAIPYAKQQETVAELPGPTWSVTLADGVHAKPFENDPSPHDDVVTATTLDFWDGTLRDDTAALDRVATDATVPGLSSVTVTP